MTNIKTAKEEVKKAGFEVEKRGIYLFGSSFEAVKKDENGKGIRASFRFGRSKGREGKPLEVVLVHAFPIFNGKREVLCEGVRAREFSETKRISSMFPDVRVRTCGVQTALFIGGKFKGKF